MGCSVGDSDNFGNFMIMSLADYECQLRNTTQLNTFLKNFMHKTLTIDVCVELATWHE